MLRRQWLSNQITSAHREFAQHPVERVLAVINELYETSNAEVGNERWASMVRVNLLWDVVERKRRAQRRA
jgi:hypothetical protein